MELDGECSVPAATRGGSTSRSHSEAERKRRQRINAHHATLRSLLPSASQMDKAALLGEVVRHVRELRDGAAAGVVVPGESDEVVVEEDECWDAGERAKRVRAWVCCADRPGLMSELGRAVRSVSASAVRAEIATVGGRTRSVQELDVGQTATAASRATLQGRAAQPGGTARRGELQETALLGARLQGLGPVLSHSLALQLLNSVAATTVKKS